MQNYSYKVLLENDQVRVLEVRMQPGDKTEMHTHPAMVAIGVRDSTFKFTFANGESAEVELKAGEARAQDAVEHTSENTGTTEALVVLVELK